MKYLILLLLFSSCVRTDIPAPGPVDDYCDTLYIDPECRDEYLTHIERRIVEVDSMLAAYTARLDRFDQITRDIEKANTETLNALARLNTKE